MLDRILINNFQGHVVLDVPLELVTTFVGPSDVGKSSALRALRWVCLNKPTGTGLIRQGAEAADVGLWAEGKRVTRTRSESANSYTFEGEEYVSLRAVPVPPAIASHLNVSDLNFQGQHDAAFWLSLTAGEVSRELNEVVNLAEIDAVLAEAAGEVKRTKALLGMVTERVEKAERQKADLSWAREYDEDLRELEGLSLTLEEVRQEVGDLLSLLARIDELEDTHARWAGVAAVGDEVLNQGTLVVQTAANAAILEMVLADVTRAEDILAADPSATWAELLAVRTEGDQSAERRRDLEHLVADIEQLEEELCQHDVDLEVAREELTRETGGRCPLCGSEADAASLLASATSTSACGHPSAGPKRGTESGVEFRLPPSNGSRK